MDGVAARCEPIAFRTVQRDLLYPPFSLSVVGLSALRGGEDMRLLRIVCSLFFCFYRVIVDSYYGLFILAMELKWHPCLEG